MWGAKFVLCFYYYADQIVVNKSGRMTCFMETRARRGEKKGPAIGANINHSILLDTLELISFVFDFMLCHCPFTLALPSCEHISSTTITSLARERLNEKQKCATEAVASGSVVGNFNFRPRLSRLRGKEESQIIYRMIPIFLSA